MLEISTGTLRVVSMAKAARTTRFLLQYKPLQGFSKDLVDENQPFITSRYKWTSTTSVLSYFLGWKGSESSAHSRKYAILTPSIRTRQRETARAHLSRLSLRSSLSLCRIISVSDLACVNSSRSAMRGAVWSLTSSDSQTTLVFSSKSKFPRDNARMAG